MTATTSQQRYLKNLFSDASGKAAFDRLRTALVTETDAIRQVIVENDFIMAAALIFRERAPQNAYISGREEKAHSVLHYILNEYRTGGDAALGRIANAFLSP